MKTRLHTLIALLLTAIAAWGQRPTDYLDRGLVAIPSGSGNFVSWRVLAEEYYDVTYNLYRNGTKVNSKPLSVSNYQDNSGTSSSSYEVAPVVRGVEGTRCAAVKPWANQYMEIMMQPVYARGGTDVTTSHKYTINDVSLGDVDGDGTTEFIVKRLNGLDLYNLDNDSCFCLIECYTLAGKRLWWIDCGPNMLSGSQVELNAVVYDWGGDGRAEVLMRGADNMVIHKADGTTQEIGNMALDTRWSGMEYTNTGAEYLLYLDGQTAEPYVVMDYPLPRYDAGETQNEELIWGSGTPGHRPTKHFFGAPFLDGRKASIFLARGIYTREKMVALDVEPATHQLTERWRWKCYDGWTNPWFGQGFHNFGIADVDMDGRDEIVYGAMVIDDNGQGLSTTGLGHGDAQHCSDFDPYRHGLELFTCQENQPAMCYRDATTAKVYYRLKGTDDDGRALCGNFSNTYPGSMGRSTQSGMVSTVADKVVSEVGDYIAWNDLNFRIFWDGDLLDEVLNSPGTEREAKIEKPGTGRIWTSTYCQMNNWTKNTPSAQGDIFGDWREELVLRAVENTRLRIWTTPTPTTHRLPTLWHDHQYRQAMVWQMCGYNQPPHKSYFTGELEGITIAPPPLTMTGRTEIPSGGTIGSSTDGQQVIVCETGDTEIQVEQGAQPWVATFNVPSWVQGTNSTKTDGTAEILRTYYTCTVTGGAFDGTMRLVKQGDGILRLPNVAQTYSGPTDIWGGTLCFDGTLLNSSLWLNRFAALESTGGQFRSIRMDYGAALRPGGEGSAASVTTDTLRMGFGSRLQVDVFADGMTADCVKTKQLTIETKSWKYGPHYLTPVVEIVAHPLADGELLPAGRYLIGSAEKITGNLSDLVIEGLGTEMKARLVTDDTDIYLELSDVRAASSIVWTGAESAVWDFAGAQNFALADNTQSSETFVTGDKVWFTDEGNNTSITLQGELEADSIIVDAAKAYTFKGTGSITGASTLVKQGTGTLTIDTDNTHTGGTRLSGGVLAVKSLAYSTQAYGNLGAATTKAAQFVIENGAELRTTAAVTQGSPMQMLTAEGGIINNTADFTTEKAISGTLLTKKGAGWMKLYATNSLTKMTIVAGAVNTFSGNAAQTVELQGGSLYDDSQATSHAIVVPKGKSATWYLTNTYYTAYANKLTGEGTLTIVPRNTVSRVRIIADWSQFEGTIKQTTKDIWLPLDAATGLPKGTLDIAEGCAVTNVARSFTIGRLTGKGSLAHPVANFQNNNGVSGSNTWNVGNDDLGDFTFAGTFIDGGGSNKSIFNKVGSCKMTVSGKSTHTGATTVKAGELHFNAGATLGTGALTVARGATLSGVTSASVPLTNSSVSVSTGGTLQVGTSATATTGSINFGDKNVTIAKGATLALAAARATTKASAGCTQLTGIKTLTINGDITLQLADTYEPAAGDSLQLVVATTIKGSPTFTLPELPEGLCWDIGQFLAKGVLHIAEAIAVAIPDEGVATFSCSQATDWSEVAEVEAYVAVIDEAQVQLTKVTGSVPAMTGLLVRSLSGVAVTAYVNPVATAEELVANDLVATAEDIGEDVLQGNYLLANGSQGLGFYRAGADATLAAGHAYLEANGQKVKFMALDGLTDAIRAIPSAPSAEQEYFSINGFRVQRPSHGIYITNRRKVLVR